jgi:hypothetical protein
MTVPGDQSTGTATDTAPRAVRIAYRAVLAVFLLMGVVQIFLAGLGVFSRGSGPGFEPHRILGFVMSGVALLIVVLALLARAGARSIGVAVLLFLLAAGGQSLLVVLAGDSAFFGGLHALEGLALLGLAGFLQSDARRVAPQGRQAPITARR